MRPWCPAAGPVTDCSASSPCSAGVVAAAAGATGSASASESEHASATVMGARSGRVGRATGRATGGVGCGTGAVGVRGERAEGSECALSGPRLPCCHGNPMTPCPGRRCGSCGRAG